MNVDGNNNMLFTSYMPITHQAHVCVLTLGAWWTKLWLQDYSTPPCWMSSVHLYLQPRTACYLSLPHQTAAGAHS